MPPPLTDYIQDEIQEYDMTGLVCPWWCGYFIDNRLRRWLHNPEQIIGPFLQPGMTVLDIGCGMGLFSIAIARLVGDGGRVVAVDLQARMLNVLVQRAAKAGVGQRIQPQRCASDDLGVAVTADLAVAFAMIHEVPDRERLLRQVRDCLRPGGRLFVAEPWLHVSGRQLEATVRAAEELGFRLSERPHVRWCRAVVFERWESRLQPAGAA